MRLIPWFIALLLCLFHLPVVVGYTGLLSYAGGGVTLEVVLYWLLVLGSGLYLIIGMIKPAFKKHGIFTICNIAVLVSLSVVLVWLFTDDKPLADDYTAADILTKANGSYQYLDVFNQGDPKALERILATVEDRDQIEAAWNQITKYRQAVDALDRFDIICDLPPNASLDMDMPFLSFRALRYTADIYHRYLIYKVEQGQGAEAVEDVSRFYGFTRKSLSHATILINKMVFLALADKSFNTAYDAIGNRRCNMQTIEALRRLYTPLQPSEFSLARALTGEYLFIKNTMQQQVRPDTFLDTVVMSSTQDEPERPTFPMASRLAYYVGFKPNMSLRHIKEIFDLIIAAQKSTPPDYSAVVRRTEIYRRRPQLRNMAGWILNTMAMPDFAPYSTRGVNTKIRSDLLAIALHKKTGRQLDINDYYTNDHYRYREEDGVMRHPGRDGRYNTDDDVVLGTLLQK
ncbi:MAG: hypothetical protein PVH87_09630 [Desulfobacteraceae bacterium]|jgi:hypothetical protein